MTGIGFRKDFAEEFLEGKLSPDFVEVAPENWIGIGGFWKNVLKQVTGRYPLYTHGLSLSIGGPDDLDMEFLNEVKKFLKEYQVEVYSEHLSFTKCNNAHLYDLLPVPFTEDAVEHVAGRIRKVQDFLERKIAIEIVSYYTPLAPEMSELEFINKVLAKADCELLLDVNNIYVNAFNHHYDAKEFIEGLPLHRVRYIHMAGHQQVSPELIIDTHGEPIIDPVYDLFDFTFSKLQREVAVLLERDFNIPELSELQAEMNTLEKIQQDRIIEERRTEHVPA